MVGPRASACTVTAWLVSCAGMMTATTSVTITSAQRFAPLRSVCSQGVETVGPALQISLLFFLSVYRCRRTMASSPVRFGTTPSSIRLPVFEWRETSFVLPRRHGRPSTDASGLCTVGTGASAGGSAAGTMSDRPSRQPRRRMPPGGPRGAAAPDTPTGLLPVADLSSDGVYSPRGVGPTSEGTAGDRACTPGEKCGEVSEKKN